MANDPERDEPRITDDNYTEFLPSPVIDGEQRGFGLEARDYEAHPVGSYAGVTPFDMDTIPMEEWPERIEHQNAVKARLSDIRRIGNNGGRIRSTDQGNQGYCWAHSPISCAHLVRATQNQPHVFLSAYHPACIIKRYANQGGWNAQCVEFLRDRGCASIATWPEKSKSRRNDNATMWDDAANYKLTDGWMELRPPVYDRDLSVLEIGTCLLSGIPVAGDFNWWRHSVCLMDLVDAQPRRRATDKYRYGIRIWNSWSDGWGNAGEGVLEGSKAWPDGATALKSITTL